MLQTYFLKCSSSHILCRSKTGRCGRVAWTGSGRSSESVLCYTGRPMDACARPTSPGALAAHEH